MGPRILDDIAFILEKILGLFTSPLAAVAVVLLTFLLWWHPATLTWLLVRHTRGGARVVVAVLCVVGALTLTAGYLHSLPAERGCIRAAAFSSLWQAPVSQLDGVDGFRLPAGCSDGRLPAPRQALAASPLHYNLVAQSWIESSYFASYGAIGEIRELADWVTRLFKNDDGSLLGFVWVLVCFPLGLAALVATLVDLICFFPIYYAWIHLGHLPGWVPPFLAAPAGVALAWSGRRDPLLVLVGGLLGPVLAGRVGEAVARLPRGKTAAVLSVAGDGLEETPVDMTGYTVGRVLGGIAVAAIVWGAWPLVATLVPPAGRPVLTLLVGVAFVLPGRLTQGKRAVYGAIAVGLVLVVLDDLLYPLVRTTAAPTDVASAHLRWLLQGCSIGLVGAAVSGRLRVGLAVAAAGLAVAVAWLVLPDAQIANMHAGLGAPGMLALQATLLWGAILATEWLVVERLR